METKTVPADRTSSEHPMLRYGRRDLEHSPLIVFYEITRACDLTCAHCRACAQPLPDPTELSSLQSRAMLDQLATFPSPPMVVLTGGDPLKRADIYDLVRHGVAAGLEIAITPSATPLVTFDAIERLRDAGVARMAVSLDGVDAATHDATRGVVGSFDRTLEIIRDAQRVGIPLQVNTTVTPGNQDQIDAMADLLADLEIVLWSVFFLVPVGRAIEQPRLSAGECEAVFERLWWHSQHQPYAVKTTEAPHFRRYALQQKREASQAQRRFGSHRPGAYATEDAKKGLSKLSARGSRPALLGLNDGKGILFVSHTGEIFPSGFLPIDCGVFPRDSIVEAYQSNTTFQGLRDANRLGGKCGRCEYRHICGGSRARTYALTGDPFGEEPDCVYEPPDARP